MPHSPKPWTVLSSKLLQKTAVFDLHVQKLRSPRNAYEDDFYYIDVVDWTNILPLTADNEVVMVEQFRFGIKQNSLELPGGMLSGNGEDPKQAALRELLEETGYAAEQAISLGFSHPNPAIQTNCCHFFYAQNVRKVADLTQDQAEDLAVHLVPLAEVPKLIAQGRITHSLMLVCFLRFFLAQQEGLGQALSF